MSTQTDFVTGIDSRIQDDESKLGPADVVECLASALNEYSHQRPRYAVDELTGDGTAFLALPSGWQAGFSKVARLDQLDSDSEPVFVPPSDYEVIENPAPEGEVLFMLEDRPTVDDTFHLKYSLAHSVTVTSSTVPSADEGVVMDLAASYALLRMAAAYAQSTDPQIGTVTVDYTSKTAEYRRLAAEYRKQFTDAMRAPARKAAGRMRTWLPASTKQFH